MHLKWRERQKGRQEGRKKEERKRKGRKKERKKDSKKGDDVLTGTFVSSVKALRCVGASVEHPTGVQMNRRQGHLRHLMQEL